MVFLNVIRHLICERLVHAPVALSQKIEQPQKVDVLLDVLQQFGFRVGFAHAYEQYHASLVQFMVKIFFLLHLVACKYSQ